MPLDMNADFEGDEEVSLQPDVEYYIYRNRIFF